MSSLSDSTTAAIVAAIGQVLHDTGRAANAVEPQMLLAADLGLDSLSISPRRSCCWSVLWESILFGPHPRVPPAPPSAPWPIS